jgi:hypothetical protein
MDSGVYVLEDGTCGCILPDTVDEVLVEYVRHGEGLKTKRTF